MHLTSFLYSQLYRTPSLHSPSFWAYQGRDSTTSSPVGKRQLDKTIAVCWSKNTSPVSFRRIACSPHPRQRQQARHFLIAVSPQHWWLWPAIAVCLRQNGILKFCCCVINYYLRSAFDRRSRRMMPRTTLNRGTRRR